MSYVGTVHDGVVVLPPNAHLPDGMEVRITLPEVEPAEDPFLSAALAAAKSRPLWPQDYVLNHGHHTSGEPRK